MYKFIVSDLDGTLLNKDRDLSSRTKKTLDNMYKLNKSLIIATGRSFPLIPNKFFDIDCLKYIIGFNGAVIYDNYYKKTIYECLIKKEVCVEILKTIDDLNLSIQLLFKDVLIFKDTPLNRKYCKLFMDSFALKSKEFSTNLTKTILEHDDNVFKFDIFGSEKDIEEAYKRLSSNNDIHVVLCDPINIEITSKNVSKGKSIELVMNRLGLEKSDFLCFGDSGNDLSMKYEGFSFVAVSNAEAIVKENADYVIGSNYDDAVAKEIDKLIENKRL